MEVDTLISPVSGIFSLLPAIAAFSAHLLESTKTLRPLGNYRKNTKSSIISEEKVYKVANGNLYPRKFKRQNDEGQQDGESPRGKFCSARGSPRRPPERLLGALRQSVPQNGRVHLHISES